MLVEKDTASNALEKETFCLHLYVVYKAVLGVIHHLRIFLLPFGRPTEKVLIHFWKNYRR